MNGLRPTGHLAARLVRAWCGLTRQEQQALIAVLALLLLGAVARWWRQAERIASPAKEQGVKEVR